MASELRYKGTPGATVKANIKRRGLRWNGSNMVVTASIADGSWTTGLVSMTELLTDNDTPTGDFVGDMPTGITTAGDYDVDFYETATPAPSTPEDGSQNVLWDGSAEVELATIATLAARLSRGTITISSPIGDDGTISIIRNDAYLDADGRALTWTLEDWEGPAVGGITVKLRIASEAAYQAGTAASVEITGSITKPADDAIVVVELTAAQTAALTLPGYRYQLVLTSSSDIISPAQGVLIVKDRVIPAS